LVVRFRFHLLTRRGEKEHPLLAEDCQVLAFRGAPDKAEWLGADEGEALLQAPAEGNVSPDRARDFLQRVLDGFKHLRPHLDEAAHRRGQELLDAHRRVRQATQMKGMTYRVEPNLPADVLGVYVYLPRD
jgi:hypothetical protein